MLKAGDHSASSARRENVEQLKLYEAHSLVVRCPTGAVSTPRLNHWLGGTIQSVQSLHPVCSKLFVLHLVSRRTETTRPASNELHWTLVLYPF